MASELETLDSPSDSAGATPQDAVRGAPSAAPTLLQKYSPLGAAVLAGFLMSVIVTQFLSGAPELTTTGDDESESPPGNEITATAPGSPEPRSARNDSEPARSEPHLSADAEQPRHLSTTEQAALRDLMRDVADFDEASDPAAADEDESADAEPVRPRKRPRVRRPAGGSRVAEAPDGPRQSITGQATLAYWNAMNGVIEQEAAMRVPPSGGVTATNAADFQNRRLAAGQYAVAGLAALDRTGVDPEILALGDSVAKWYADGLAICEKGKYLLEKADPRTRKGPEGKAWQDADKSHQQSVSALNASGEQVRARMQEKHHLPFPPLK